MSSQPKSDWSDPDSVSFYSSPIICPICKRSATRTLERRNIYLSDQAETRRVGAQLAVFRCDREGHVFFVRADDLAEAEESAG